MISLGSAERYESDKVCYSSVISSRRGRMLCNSQSPVWFLWSSRLRCWRQALTFRLIEAARSGNSQAVRTLLASHLAVGTAEPDGSTALHEAAHSDNVDIADQLIAAGADVKASTRYNITPLSLACSNGSATMIEHLLKAGADPNGTSEEGQTALMTAALTGKVDAIKVLLAHGAQVNVQEPIKGQSALMWAASEGNTAAVALLIESGADVRRNRRAVSLPSCLPCAAATRTLFRHCWHMAPMPTTRRPTVPARSIWLW